MAEGAAATVETKKIINPRVEIDTSPPFESVKEAVDRFGGSGPWIPHHLLRLAAAHHENEVFDVDKMEEQAVQLERDLIMKEQQTLDVLKELEEAKRFVEGLKVNLMPELFSFMTSPDLKLETSNDNSTERLTLCPMSPGSMFLDLNQAKLNLNKTSIDLALIQASVESLNKKLRNDKVLLERRTKMQIRNSQGPLSSSDNHHMSRELKQGNFEAEQFKNMTEASRYEVMRAMTDIERTKNSIKMAEMRLNAAKKMEEAAKAVEAIALLNGDNSSSDSFLQNPNDGITLSLQEYKALTQKAKQAEELCKTKFIDEEAHHHLEMPILEKFEATAKENNLSKFKFRNSHGDHRNQDILDGNESKEKAGPGFRSTTSIGDVLSRKLIVQDDVMIGRRVENRSERQHVSLSQMLREQSRIILHPAKRTADRNVEKQYFVQRKKFGFIQVPIPTKQSKKKDQPLNAR